MSGTGFHYLRTPWEGGGVARLDGEPAGARLLDLLRAGLPPTRVALEMAAAFCEMLYIAAEDEAVHGDLGVEHAWLNGDGTLSLGGFGPARRSTRAPEGVVRGTQTDRYGLGRLCAAVLMPGSVVLDEVPFTGANAHDRAVAEHVDAAELGDDDPDRAAGLRWTLRELLRFDPAARPELLRTWQALVVWSRAAPGPDLAGWAALAHRGQAPVRELARLDDVEGLGGPVAQAGPLDTSLRFTDSAHQTTFWRRPEPPPREPAPPPPEPAPPPAPGSAPVSSWGAAEPPRRERVTVPTATPGRAVGRGKVPEARPPDPSPHPAPDAARRARQAPAEELDAPAPPERGPRPGAAPNRPVAKPRAAAASERAAAADAPVAAARRPRAEPVAAPSVWGGGDDVRLDEPPAAGDAGVVDVGGLKLGGTPNLAPAAPTARTQWGDAPVMLGATTSSTTAASAPPEEAPIPWGLIGFVAVAALVFLCAFVVLLYVLAGWYLAAPAAPGG